jgi:hypothetical protein
MMVQNDNVVDCINFFPLIKPCMVCFILPRFIDLDQCVINELNDFGNSNQGNLLYQMCTIRFHLQVHGWCMMWWTMHHHIMQISISSTWRHHTYWCCHLSWKNEVEEMLFKHQLWWHIQYNWNLTYDDAKNKINWNLKFKT